MVVVAGTITFDPARHQAMIAAARRVEERTRAEDGCISYEFFADLTEPGRLHLFEEWEDCTTCRATGRTAPVDGGSVNR